MLYRVSFFVVILMSVLVLSVSAQTHFAIESQNLVSNNELSPAITGYMTHGFTESQLGTFAWLLVGEHWAEGYAGLTYMPLSWCQVGLGFGMEQADDLWRVGGSLWIGNGSWSILMLLENGGSGFWHRVVVNYRIGTVVGIGFMSQESVGVGPRFELNVPKLPVQLWASLLRKDRNNKGYLTLKFSF